jgi:hypothetical protein
MKKARTTSVKVAQIFVDHFITDPPGISTN